MIDRTHKLPLAQQCRILELARSTAYYQPVPVIVAHYLVSPLAEQDIVTIGDVPRFQPTLPASH